MPHFLLFALPALLQASAMPQVPRLVDTWRLVAVDNVLKDGTRVPLYGEHPEGILTFDARGNYAIQILRAARPRFASGDKAKGTVEENAAAVQGNNSHFGRYEVDAGARTLTFRIDHAFFPNWEGTVQVRPFRLQGDELVYTVPSPTTGGVVTGEVRWRRVR